jgi:hypothetical protein
MHLLVKGKVIGGIRNASQMYMHLSLLFCCNTVQFWPSQPPGQVRNLDTLPDLSGRSMPCAALLERVKRGAAWMLDPMKMHVGHCLHAIQRQQSVIAIILDVLLEGC